MTELIIIGIIIFVIWLFNSNSSSSSNYSNISTEKTENYISTVYDKPNTQVSSSPQAISVSPTRISSNPDLKVSLIDGQYRYFQNHYYNGKQYTFGFPKENCPDRRVWVGIEKEEIERISYSEAMRRIGSKNIMSNQTKYLNATSNDLGYCAVCNKKLRGNIYKEKCYECYTNGTTKVQKVGYCSNCGKKLRGNIHKKHCTECYHNGYR
jgi:hypothetical protein